MIMNQKVINELINFGQFLFFFFCWGRRIYRRRKNV